MHIPRAVRNASQPRANHMTSIKQSVVCAAITLCSFFGGFGIPAAAACSPSMLMTYNGGYVDAFPECSGGIYLVFWGFGTYGDPQGFHDAAEFLFNGASTSRSFGITSTR